MLLDFDFLRLATSWFALYRERTDNKLTEMLFENTSCNVELEFADLSSLEILNMTSNLLYGTIPRELSSVTSLQTLILDDNVFSARLPEWLGSFSILTVLV